MYNNSNDKNNHHHNYYYNSNFPPLSSPRISFSNDFVESHVGREPRVPPPSTRLEFPAAASSDFEFSVSNHSMTSADELFFKGRILPSFQGNRTKTTLREELLAEDDEEEEEASSRAVRGNGGRWKGLLGLRKGGKKGDINKCQEGPGDKVCDNNSSQETMKDGVVNKFKK